VNGAMNAAGTGGQRWLSGQDHLTMAAITAAAVAGDPICQAVITKAGRFLGIALANLVNLFNPGLIILGGDIVVSGDLLMNPVRASVKLRAMPKAAQEVTITISKLGNDAVVIGAATLAILHAFQPAQLSGTLRREQRLEARIKERNIHAAG
jgi:predicted NBD/HSP70 family sugar kinase